METFKIMFSLIATHGPGRSLELHSTFVQVTGLSEHAPDTSVAPGEAMSSSCVETLSIYSSVVHVVSLICASPLPRTQSTLLHVPHFTNQELINFCIIFVAEFCTCYLFYNFQVIAVKNVI